MPVLAPPTPQNQTANELAKAEEARELARASTKGWEIINALDGQCLYFMSGWWSYSYCYNKDVVQFHALPNNLKSGAPSRDPQSQEYVLGRVTYDAAPHKQSRPNHRLDPDATAAATTGTSTTTPPPSLPAPPNSELAVKDNQRYLLQRLDGGTLCDLTGRERTIEVQYHCHPGIPGDRIGWIKEVTTCTYLMVVQTPRLCADVAFLPPREGRAHPITCQPIGDGRTDEGWFGVKGEEGAGGIAAAAGHAAEIILGAAAGGAKDGAKPAAAGQTKHAGITIGGVVVGGRATLGTGADGSPAARLPAPRQFGSNKVAAGGGTVVEILAKGNSKADGGKVEFLTNEEIEKLDLSPESIEELRRELQKLAGENGWKLEVVEVPGEVPEIRGIVEGEGEDDEEDGQGGGNEGDGVFTGHTRRSGGAKETKGGEKEGKTGGEKGRKTGGEKEKNVEEDGEEEDGSEERFFGDEL